MGDSTFSGGGLCSVGSSYFTDLCNFTGFISGILSNVDALSFLIDVTDNNNILPVKQLRASTTGFTEMHNSTNLVVLDTVGDGTYTVPNDVTNALVVLIGGGGATGIRATSGTGGIGGNDGSGSSDEITLNGGDIGGTGGRTSDINLRGCGGGAGGYQILSYEFNSNTVSYTVGAGGKALNNDDVLSINGGDSIFDGIKYGAQYTVGNQDYIIPNGSKGGVWNAYCGNGGGGFGGGNYRNPDNTEVSDTGGLTYGIGGFGVSWSGSGTMAKSVGGGGYGGGGGGVTFNFINGTAGNGGQGVIALYLGHTTYIE